MSERQGGSGVSKGLRATVVVIALAAAAAVITSVAVWIGGYPPTVAAASTGGNSKDVNVHLMTVGALGYGPHADWVSYLVQNPDGKWVHTSLIQVPAHATVHVTVYQFDSGSNIRNPLMYQVQGVDGGQAYLNGKPYSTYYSDAGVGHTFTIPQLGISVPLPGVSTPEDSPQFCNVAAPCPLSLSHNTITFSFHTGSAATYTWQCFVPCAVGYIAGFGGPMSTYGYMNGYLKVVA